VELDKLLKTASLNYKLLKAQTSQQLLRLLDKNWVSFFHAIKDWKVHPEKYRGKPNLPHYKEKEDHFLLIFTNQNCKIENNQLIITMSETFQQRYPTLALPLTLCIPPYVNKSFIAFHQIRILPRRSFFDIEIIYEEPVLTSTVDYTRFASIDLGMNNLVTVVQNQNVKPILISGRLLKSINQRWNKQKAQLSSIKDKQKMKWTTLLNGITTNRNAIVRDYLHKVARFLIKYCLDHHIGNICIGKLQNIKDGIQLGRKNNQAFVNIPLQKLKQLIKYKARLVGIRLIEKNEAYTSKCSSLDLEPIRKQKNYLGKRITRGLFKGNNYILNADVNGALNLMRKVVGDAFIRTLTDRGCWFQPIRIRNLVQTSYEQLVSSV
jgi:putative transposase